MFRWNRVTQGIPKPFRNCIGTSNSQEETPIWLGDEWDLDPPTRTYTSLFCISTNWARLFLNSHYNSIIEFLSTAYLLKVKGSKALYFSSLLKVKQIFLKLHCSKTKRKFLKNVFKNESNQLRKKTHITILIGDQGYLLNRMPLFYAFEIFWS